MATPSAAPLGYRAPGRAKATCWTTWTMTTTPAPAAPSASHRSRHQPGDVTAAAASGTRTKTSARGLAAELRSRRATAAPTWRVWSAQSAPSPRPVPSMNGYWPERIGLGARTANAAAAGHA